MPIHDWTRVYAEIFHDFHHSWISTTKHALNQGVLPPDYYALAEQVAGGLHLDVLTLGRDAEAEIQARIRNRIAIAVIPGSGGLCTCASGRNLPLRLRRRAEALAGGVDFLASRLTLPIMFSESAAYLLTLRTPIAAFLDRT